MESQEACRKQAALLGQAGAITGLQEALRGREVSDQTREQGWTLEPWDRTLSFGTGESRGRGWMGEELTAGACVDYWSKVPPLLLLP